MINVLIADRIFNKMLKVISQLAAFKPMPIPFSASLPEKAKTSPRRGKEMIDIMMDEDTANNEERRYPNMRYVDHGTMGIVYQNHGTILKYVFDKDEVEMAQHLMDNPIPCVVNVYSVDQIQKNDNKLWVISMQKVKPLEWKYSDDAWHKYRKEISKLEHCLNDHGYRYNDLTLNNIGWDNMGNLVVLDIGGLELY